MEFSKLDDDFGNFLDCEIHGTGTVCDGYTVQEIYDDANLVLGGCAGTTGLGAGDLADCLDIINENYVDGILDREHLCP